MARGAPRGFLLFFLKCLGKLSLGTCTSNKSNPTPRKNRGPAISARNAIFNLSAAPRRKKNHGEFGRYLYMYIPSTRTTTTYQAREARDYSSTAVDRAGMD